MKDGLNFNPKYKKFIKDNPDITMLKLSWALFWRLQLVLLPVSIVLSVLLTAVLVVLERGAV